MTTTKVTCDSETLKWEGDVVKGSYITFQRKGLSKSHKTMIWYVFANDLDYYGERISIGEVKWFFSWRCYAFYPAPETVFEKTCLKEISEFCSTLTEEHRMRKKA